MDAALHIEVADLDGCPCLRLAATASPRPAAILIGKRPEEAVRLVGLLFNLCPAAHIAASSLALGLPPADGADLALAHEILREHAMVMLRDWPRALGLPARPEALSGLMALSPERLERLEGDLLSEQSLPLTAMAEVARWPQVWGCTGVSSDPTYFTRCMTDEFVAPTLSDAAPSLHRRMAARLREAARLIGEIKRGSFAPRFGTVTPGTGWAEAARGRLEHHAVVAGGRIEAYAIATPTEAMMASGGFLETLLTSALQAPQPMRDKVLAMALTCADPCISVILSTKAA